MAIFRTLGVVTLAMLTGLLQAEELSVEDTIGKALINAQPNLIIKSATQVPGQNLYEVELISGDTLYSTPDGQYLIHGSLYKTEVGGLVNVTEQKGAEKRAALIAQLDPKEMVVFKGKGEEKAIINVFTDVDCGYCRKLHREVPRLNEMGVTVQYMAYPRAGVYEDRKQTKLTGSYKKLKSVWCDEDRSAAMNKAKATGFIKENLGCDAPIEKQLALGAEFGVRGTPAILLPNGEMVPGYMAADELVKKLGL
ncbi:bifunctional protein-disulfide isomerase/oxidoreductase DsbC [Oceaniserpentilla sp. 4NH20-0058]|uniref:DsbC family protein n=1 Tax=Oceaniserpentilla sp. 4NH20-0058 TaxID=3127660 RepID=UPI00310483DA